jgi:hypothetical protein
VTDILTVAESTALAEHEAVIERGIKTFYEVGLALADIRDRNLYRADYGTFEEYAEQRWQMSRSRAYQMIDAAGVVSTIVDTELPPPANEGQARELGRVPEPERAAVWAETVERTDGKPTAAAVRETYEQRHAPSDDDLLAGGDWVQSDGPAFDDLLDASSLSAPHVVAEAEPIPPQVQEQLTRAAKRRPLPEVLGETVHDFVRIAERFDRLRQDDRFDQNRHQTHHRASDYIRALESVAQLAADMNLPAAETSEEARRWWATSLHNISDALADVANSIEQEQ